MIANWWWTAFFSVAGASPQRPDARRRRDAQHGASPPDRPEPRNEKGAIGCRPDCVKKHKDDPRRPRTNPFAGSACLGCRAFAWCRVRVGETSPPLDLHSFGPHKRSRRAGPQAEGRFQGLERLHTRSRTDRDQTKDSHQRRARSSGHLSRGACQHAVTPEQPGKTSEILRRPHGARGRDLSALRKTNGPRNAVFTRHHRTCQRPAS